MWTKAHRKRLTATRGRALLDREIFYTEDGVGLGVKRYDDGRGRAVVIGLHGISGAASDFDPLGESLVRRGFSMLSWNQRGQGLDPRPRRRGDLDDWQRLVGDAREFFRLVQEEAGERPVFVCGESMGALVAINAASAGAFDGASGMILMSPVVALRGQQPPRWLRLLVLAALHLAPGLRIDPSKLAPKDQPPVRIAADLAYQTERDAAPHRVREFTFRFFRNLIALTESAAACPEQVTLPTLVVYAGNDYFVHPKAVEGFFGRLGARDKSSKLWPDAYHLLLFDPATPDVIDTITRWIEKRCQRM